MIKQKKLLLIVFLISCIPLSASALIFQKKDDNGFYYYVCEGQRLPIRIKVIEKNTYKVLSRYHGFVINAETEFEAAQQVCGEVSTQKPKPE